jgi:hypothetical protein
VHLVKDVADGELDVVRGDHFLRDTMRAFSHEQKKLGHYERVTGSRGPLEILQCIHAVQPGGA